MSAADREAERRFPLWLPTGDYEIDREDYSELDAKWQNEDTERDRAHFVQGAEWQADHDHRIDAVRALHQPLDAINVDAPPGRQRTRVCAVCAGSNGPWAVWPCATIQAIEGDDR